MVERKRRRVSREHVRQNAQQGAQTVTWFDLPEGVDIWKPDKAKRVNIDIIPYEVKDKDHPDKVEAGVLWYKYPFQVHHGVGLSSDSIVCPISVHQRCPICEERARLAKDWDENEEQIRAISPQKYVAYNVLNPEDSDKVAIFAISRGKFAAPLELELDEGDDEILNFYDVTKEGKTLRVRFSKESYQGRPYLQATKIDFEDRDEMDEDDILGKTVCLDTMFSVLPYEKIKSMFLQEGGDEEEPDEESSPRKQKQEKDEEEDEDEKEESKEDEGKEEEPEPEEENSQPRQRRKRKKSTEIECPAGGKFGKDIDKFKECDDCPHWDKCEEASE